MLFPGLELRVILYLLFLMLMVDSFPRPFLMFYFCLCALHSAVAVTVWSTMTQALLTPPSVTLLVK